MKFVIAGAAGLGFVSNILVSPALAQSAAPADTGAPTNAPAATAAPGASNAPAAANGQTPANAGTPSDAAAPHQAPAPSGTQEGAPAGGESHGATTDAAEVEHTEHGIFPPFNSATYASQLFWLVIIFGAFYVFLKRVVLPQVGGIIETREARIKQDLDQAGRLKTEADAAVSAYEQALAEARARASGIGQAARDKAKADAEAERKRVEGDLDAKLSEAQGRIDGIKASAMSEVGTIASDTAEAIVQALTGGQADRQAVDAAVSAVRS